jgi:hypothetical protein
MGNTFFEIFILVDVFLMGALAAVAFQHAREHYKPSKSEPEAPQIAPTVDAELPQEVKDRLMRASQEKYQAVLKHSADQLQQELGVSGEQINNMVVKLASEIVGGELERYRIELSKLHKQAEADLSGVRKEVTGHEAELKAKMAAELQAEKLRLIKQIDTKLGDAVGSFLTETLQHEVDLGSQTSYLLAMLEEHKADFKKEVADDAQPAK